MGLEIVAYSSLLLSLGACVAACIATYRSENLRLRKLERLVNEVLAEQINQTDLHARLQVAVRKIRNRMNGDDSRKKQTGVRNEDRDESLPDPETDPEGWKREIMRRNPRGALS